MSTIPLLDLKAQYASIQPEIDAAIARVLRSQQFVLGPEVEALEREIAAFCGTAHAVGVSSGSDALLATLMALGLGPGDEVITTAFSFFATAGAILRLGARPVFVDVEPEGLNLDVEAAAQAIGPRTKAVLPVHLFGRCAELDPLLLAARAAGVPVVEDAAQAIGATDAKGRRAGSLGLAGCFSFFPSKNLGAFGDGGMVVTSDAELAHRLRILRQHGAEPRYHHAILGGNFRLDALQAAVLRAKLPHLPRWNAARRAHALDHAARLEARELLDRLRPLPDAPGHVYHQLVVRAQDRDGLRAFLAREGIGTEIYYPLPLPLQPCLSHLGHRAGDFPEAEAAAKEVLALPVYPELPATARERIVESIARFYRQEAP